MKKNLVRIQLLILSLVAAIFAAVNVHAAQIQGVTISSVSGQLAPSYSTNVYLSVTNLVTSAGLYGDEHSYLPGGCMWLSQPGANGTNYVTFNLGGVYTVNGMKVWNYNDSSFYSGASGRNQFGVSNAAIAYSTDGINFTTSIASQNFNIGSGNSFYPMGQSIAFPSAVTAQYIRINIKTNWGGGVNGVGLSKVRFVSNTNPPTVLSASENFGSNQVTVIFSESVSNATAISPANYSLTCSGAAPTITGVAMGEYQDRVILTTTPLTNNNYKVSVSGVYDEASTIAVTNNSTVAVQSEVYLWLSAGAGVTTSSSIIPNMVTAWSDQSSYAHNAASANFYGVLTNGPVLVSSVINGKPVLRFYGTNVLQIPNDAANPINGDFTVFLVASPATDAAQGNPICKEGGGSTATSTNNLGAPLDFGFAGGSLKPSLNLGNSGALGTSVSPGQALAAGTFSVTAISITGTNTGQQTIANLGQVIVNGSSPMFDLTQSPTNKLSADLLMAAAPQDAGNPISIGARNDSLSAVPYFGDIAEIIWIRGTITPNDLKSIENYLATKYAISPVSISEQPAGVTVNAGNQATFWVGASGMQPYTFQWYSNSVAIPGATSQSYTTPYLTTSANGANYTVAVTNASGGTLSTAAALGVVSPVTGPTVFSAAKASSTSVVVVFSEAIDSTTGLNAANYSIDGGVSVTSVAAGSSANQVVLTTSAQNVNGLYHLTVKNVQDQYGHAIATVTVPMMPSDLTMWLRADSGVVTNPAAGTPGAVDAWLDQTANGNNAQTYGIGPGYRPTLGTDSQANNEPAVFFTGSSDQYLVAPGSPGLNMVGDMSVYMVLNVNGGYSTYRALISKAQAGTRGCSYDLYLNTGTGGPKWNRGDGTSYHTGTESPNVVPAGLPVAFGMVHQGSGLAEQPNAGTGYEYLNGQNSYSIQFQTATMGDYGRLLVLGARGSYDLFMNGDIAEVMVFSNAIAGSDRTNIDNYLGAKYFMVTNSTPLTNETVNAGGYATFNATPSQGPAHLAYQWQENGTNIPGATSPSYTFGPAQVTDNGDQFDLLVIAGSVTNELGPVTLTVISVPPVVQTFGAPFWRTNVIAVNFQTPLNPALATNVANYIFNNGTVLFVQLVSPTEVFVYTTTLNPAYTNQLTIKNLQDDFGSTMTLTNLSAVSAGYPTLSLWLRADQGINPSAGTPNNGDQVTEWDDQSTNMNNFIGFAGYVPTYVTNALNGYPSLAFYGTNGTYLYTTVNSPSSLMLNGDLTIFSVMNFATFLNTNGLPAGGEGGGEIISETDPTLKGTPSSFDYYCYYGGAHGPLLLRGNGVNAQAQFSGGFTMPTNTWVEFSAMSAGAVETHRLVGHTNSAQIAWSLTGGTATTAAYVTIGQRLDGALALNGQMAELIVVDSALSAYDTDAIETYLGTKYGLNSPGSPGISKANVSWPNPLWYTLLQSTPNLAPSAWSTVTNATSLVNGTNSVSLPTSASPQMFYRLQSTSQ